MRDPRYGASVYAAHHCSALNHAWNVPQDCSCEAHKSAVTIDSWQGWPPRPHWGRWGRQGELHLYFRIMPIMSIHKGQVVTSTSPSEPSRSHTPDVTPMQWPSTAACPSRTCAGAEETRSKSGSASWWDRGG